MKTSVEEDFDPYLLNIEWKFITNHYKNNNRFLCSINFLNNSKQSLPSSGWRIYFNLRYHSPSLKSISSQFEIKHVNGELFHIKPTSVFKDLRNGQASQMEFSGETGNTKNKGLTDINRQPPLASNMAFMLICIEIDTPKIFQREPTI
jgi:hypothetical protein